jgi:hypothetical protein
MVTGPPHSRGDDDTKILGESEMPINYQQLMALKNLGQKYGYGDRDVMLYAYGIGLGADPMDEKELLLQ